jgi:DNA invertase Pin-like site-specific DNA recombinase
MFPFVQGLIVGCHVNVRSGDTMLIGYMRVSKADGSQLLDLQRDALQAAGIDSEHVYEDMASGSLDARPGLTACLKALRKGDRLLVWKLDRLGRNLRHLINTVHDLTARGIGFQVLTVDQYGDPGRQAGVRHLRRASRI